MNITRTMRAPTLVTLWNRAILRDRCASRAGVASTRAPAARGAPVSGRAPLTRPCTRARNVAGIGGVEGLDPPGRPEGAGAQTDASRGLRRASPRAAFAIADGCATLRDLVTTQTLGPARVAAFSGETVALVASDSSRAAGCACGPRTPWPTMARRPYP
jgi:hypothetical protein